MADVSIEIPQELRTRYLTRRTEDTRKLQVALREKRWEIFGETGLQISTTAQNFGFPQLVKIAMQLIEVGERKPAVEPAVVLEEFATCVLKLSELIRSTQTPGMGLDSNHANLVIPESIN